MTTQTNYGFIFKELQEVASTPVTEVKVEEVKTTIPPTPAQWGLYTRMCEQKFVTPQDISSFDKKTISTEIDRLMKFNPANKNQRDKVAEKVESLTTMLEQLSFTDEQKEAFLTKENDLVANIIGQILTQSVDLDPILPTLTGGLNGTASKLISGLIDVERNFTNQLPPTEPQVEMMVNMFLFADAEFEEYGVVRRINLEEGLWRKPTPQEFADNIKANMTKSEASAFIDKHRGGFYNWKQTRIKPEQFKYIQQLQDRMGNDSKVVAVEQAVMQDGTIVDVPGQKNESIVGSAYTPLSIEQLAMMSIEDASTFIDQLKKELDDRPKSTLEDTLSNPNALRNIESVQENINIEYQAFLDLMFSLEAVAGYECTELHESATYDLVADDSPEANIKNRSFIRNFMKELLGNGSITFLGLLELCSESVTAQRIILDM